MEGRILNSYKEHWCYTHRELSNREQQILHLVTLGNCNKEIASLLGISEQTVKNHVSSILRITNCANRTQAATRNLVSIRAKEEEYMPYFMSSYAH